MTLAWAANEKPVTLLMPASLPECSRTSTISRTQTMSCKAMRNAFSTRGTPS